MTLADIAPIVLKPCSLLCYFFQFVNLSFVALDWNLSRSEAMAHLFDLFLSAGAKRRRILYSVTDVTVRGFKRSRQRHGCDAVGTVD